LIEALAASARVVDVDQENRRQMQRGPSGIE